MNDMKDEFIDYDVKRQEMASDATLRDYFAAKAMQSLLITSPNMGYGEKAEHAYLIAERMMEARVK